MATSLHTLLDELYDRYNRREFIHPDPLEYVHRYADARDRELVGLIASSLAYGRVAQIGRSIECLLSILGPAPFFFVRDESPERLREAVGCFKHRFATGDEMAALLRGAKSAIARHGSLNECFLSYHDSRHETVIPALTGFVQEIAAGFGGRKNHLLPSPATGSACKRLHLFLRWMVRCDEVDPGVWKGVSQAKLMIPLDVHMHRIARALGMTRRRQANQRTALEITEEFREIAPEDPVRYDFALTRLGIREDADIAWLLERMEP